MVAQRASSRRQDPNVPSERADAPSRVSSANSAEKAPRTAGLQRSGRALIAAILVAGLAAGAFVLAVALVLVPNADQFFANEKAWELTTQFLFVGVLGAGVALAYRQWEKVRADEAQLLEKERADEAQRLEKEREQRALYRDRLGNFIAAWSISTMSARKLGARSER